MRKKPKKLQSVRLEDVTIPEGFSLKKQGISQSLLGAWQCCPLRFLLSINRWVLPSSDRVFEFGNIYHEMLDQSFQSKKFPSKAVLKGRLKRYAKKREKQLSDVALAEFDNNLMLSEMILQEYIKYYEDEFEKIDVVKSEQLFEVDFYGYKLRGKKDLRFRYTGKNSIWIRDHKTMSRHEEEFLMSSLSFDLQNLFYITCDDIEYGDNVTNADRNMIRNPGHKVHKGESYKEYTERVREIIQEKPEHFFIRYNCTYSGQMKRRFKTELRGKLELIKKFLEGFIPFYRNECACKMPYRCQYLDACSSGKLSGYVQQKTMFPELEEEK